MMFLLKKANQSASIIIPSGVFVNSGQMGVVVKDEGRPLFACPAGIDFNLIQKSLFPLQDVNNALFAPEKFDIGPK
jgi:hypothetical protein